MTPSEQEEVLTILSEGTIRPKGQFLWGSNYTFLVHVSHQGTALPAVYKPSKGERPLWDFPVGTLGDREVAAFVVSRSLTWDLVPPTVLRRDGPAGGGSLQLFVEVDPERHYFTFSDEEKQRLRPTVLFDFLVNNADRKGGHVLLAPDGHIWLIDHGICFHDEDKLRTVIWDFAGEKIPSALLEDVRRFRSELKRHGDLNKSLSALLAPQERRALLSRATRLLESGIFPEPGPGRPYPWPLV
jgi:uncharacterized repeat protein (TIGR03843 family)